MNIYAIIIESEIARKTMIKIFVGDKFGPRILLLLGGTAVVLKYERLSIPEAHQNFYAEIPKKKYSDVFSNCQSKFIKLPIYNSFTYHWIDTKFLSFFKRKRKSVRCLENLFSLSK